MCCSEGSATDLQTKQNTRKDMNLEHCQPLDTSPMLCQLSYTVRSVRVCDISELSLVPSISPKSKPKTKTTSSDETDEQGDYISLSIVKQLMAQQESAFKSIVESLMKATTLRVDNLVKEVAELKYSLEYSQKDIASQQTVLDKNIVEIQSITGELSNVKMSLDAYCNKTTDLENRSRRNNIRIIGIPEKRNETWEESEVMVKAALTEKLVLAQEPRIERAHRVGKPTQLNGSARETPRHIVCRLYDWKEKQSILKQARIIKPSGLYVHEDVAEATMAKRREQMPRLRQAKQEGKIAYFVLDKLVIKDKRPGSINDSSNQPA